jgi:predicted O-methyltransferase YrrM
VTPEESAAWHPEIRGYSLDILPWYWQIATELPKGSEIVEVGVYLGRSMLLLAERLRELGHGEETRIVGVDSPNPKPPCGPPDHHRLLANLRDRRGAYEPVRVEMAFCDSVEGATRFQDRSLTLVFIDALHAEESVREDITAWLPKVKPGGLLSGHDYGQWDCPGVKPAVDDLLGAVSHENTVWWKRIT